MDATQRITVVVPTYRTPPEALQRLVDSLDAQTLPQDEFEVIFIDDGSPDDTYEVLRAVVADRPNYRAERIENSGWPSRPRNIATRLARGRYVVYVDHDDTLYPDALRRCCDYADETGADLLSPKESKSSDLWWGIPALSAGNLADIKSTHELARLLPMVPHKVYRRDFVVAHDIRFPEASRMLWEDVYFNLEAYAKADRVAVLADTPVYLWHASASNNSKTYGPSGEEFWDRLDDLCAFADRVLADLPVEHREGLLFQYRSRALDRVSTKIGAWQPDQQSLAMRRARQIRNRHIRDEWLPYLPKRHQRLARMVDLGVADLLAAMDACDRRLKLVAVLSDLRWEGPRLTMRVTLCMEGKDGPGFRRTPDGVFRVVPDELAAVLDRETYRLEEDLSDINPTLVVRARNSAITWHVPLIAQDRTLADDGVGGVAPQVCAEATIDLTDAHVADECLLDFSARLNWGGFLRSGAATYAGDSVAIVVDKRTLVAYRNTKGQLSIDSCLALRSVVLDGQPRLELQRGFAGGVMIPLGLDVAGAADLDAGAVQAHRLGVWHRILRRPPGDAALSDRDGSPLAFRLIAQDGRAELTASAPLPRGRYALTQERHDGRKRLPWLLTVDRSGVWTVSRDLRLS